MSQLALNEACEPPYAYSSHLLNAGSFLVLAPAVLFAAASLGFLCFARSSDAFGRHACLAQLAYHCTHLYIHGFVDMGIPANTARWNPVLVFHFAHQAGALGALYMQSHARGFLAGFGVVYAAWGATGMIYPSVWSYLSIVFLFRTPMGWPILASSLYTLAATGLEVKMCDTVKMRAHGDDDRGFPYHILADAGQAASVFLQCIYLLHRSTSDRKKVQ